MELGLVVSVDAKDPRAPFARAASAGVTTCHVCATAPVVCELGAGSIVRAASDEGLRVSAFFVTFPGCKYNRATGPANDGLVPERFRAERLDMLICFLDAVKGSGVTDVGGHMGFIPDDENSPLYRGFLDTMRRALDRAAANGLRFMFETGQEPASTLARTIRDLDAPHAGVNLDPANLVIYGTSNPLDALEILGDHVFGMHAKDAIPPDRDEVSGHEVPLGEGIVPFTLLIPRLAAKGFRGPVTIEREVSGERHIPDARKAVAFLSPILAACGV
jgi:L-ribulose-5-phosphate 3-epimerase